MGYDFGLLANTTSIITIFSAANDYTDGLFGLFILLTVGFAMYFGLSTYETQRNAVVGATFTIFIVSFFLRLLGLINYLIFGASIILFAVALVMLFNKD